MSMHTPQILIVEDELVTRNSLKSIFEAEGYDVLEANNGDEMHEGPPSMYEHSGELNQKN